jgi:signal transduction histidine kinase
MLTNVGEGNLTNVDLCRQIGATLTSHRPKSLPAVTPEEMPAAFARARQSAVLAERNRLAGEIHDGLAQIFTVICMQLGVAEEELSAKEGDPLGSIQRALELASSGLAEARRFAHKLRSNLVDESGLAVALRRLVERSSVPGRLRCDFRSGNIPEKSLSPRVQHELLRIAQEAIHNAVRHASPTVIAVALRWDAPNLVLQVKDNGSGISAARLEKNAGFGLESMRERASEIDGRLEIQTASGQGTTIIVTVPISSFQLGSRRGRQMESRSVGLRHRNFGLRIQRVNWEVAPGPSFDTAQSRPP